MAYANPEDKKAYDKKYRKENGEAVRARYREYRKENPEKYQKYEARRNAKPKRKLYMVAAGAKRRVKQRGNKAPKSWGPRNPKKINEVFELAAWLTKNRVQNYAVDHIIPVSRGGADHQRNMRVVTQNTNGRKGNKLDSECDFNIYYWVWETA
jgi:5-methylcytosine-specific restriction endonuclease McrA